ncbi:unnamed protein product [Dibothriocephalus latus]|uniref:EamA domain-containing protein n=1 Tax=Dibothriocephalus latus TaxID=60516 RepID=A0A3P6S5J7_DIBLA|nr:unnamed protein product [Dibothriocephalus latus]
MNSTESAATGMNSPTAGWVAIVIAALGFGTNYLPVKKFKMGDGMFFQWIMCNAILLVGVIVNCAVGCPKFYPLAMFGGALWATGNALIVTIIEAIGVGLGILIWSMANMLFGFASSRFGWFGIPCKIPSKPVMNYIGVGIALGSVLIYAAIKPSQNEEKDSDLAMRDMLNENVENASEKDVDSKVDVQNEKGFSRFLKPIGQMPMVQRRLIGIFLSIGAGAFFGNTFVPTIYIQGRYPNASRQGLDYVFANFAGIWLASTTYFVIYACAKRNQPWVPASSAILPALVSGILWAAAQSAWFVANAALGEPITFPIVTTVPALIATICGLVFFKEITGLRNYILLGCAFCVTAVGAIHDKSTAILSYIFRFGWFGIPCKIPSKPLMNYIGVGIALGR